MARYVTEFIGTFFFALTVCLSIAAGSALAPLAWGVVLVALILLDPRREGGYFNPVITIALWVRGAFPAPDAAGLLVAQFAGAAAAGGVASYVAGRPGAAGELPWTCSARRCSGSSCSRSSSPTWPLIAGAAAVSRRNGLDAFAVGFVVTAAGLVLTPISAAVLNPAVALAVGTFGALWWSTLGWYALVHVAAALAAGALVQLYMGAAATLAIADEDGSEADDDESEADDEDDDVIDLDRDDEDAAPRKRAARSGQGMKGAAVAAKR